MAGATALADAGYWTLVLFLYEGGTPCGRGLTFFDSACGLALRAVLRTFTSLREDVIRQKKVSKEKATPGRSPGLWPGALRCSIEGGGRTLAAAAPPLKSSSFSRRPAPLLGELYGAFFSRPVLRQFPPQNQVQVPRHFLQCGLLREILNGCRASKRRVGKPRLPTHDDLNVGKGEGLCPPYGAFFSRPALR